MGKKPKQQNKLHIYTNTQTDKQIQIELRLLQNVITKSQND